MRIHKKHEDPQWILWANTPQIPLTMSAMFPLSHAASTRFQWITFLHRKSLSDYYLFTPIGVSLWESQFLRRMHR